MKVAIISFLICTGFSCLSAQIDSALAVELQSVLDSKVENSGDRGVSAYVIMPDGQSWAGVAGVGRNNVAMTDKTLFHGASTTKLNIAVLYLLLQEKALVDLDKSWNYYVSLDVEFDTTITIRQLLNHTSGIADYLETPSSGAMITADFDHFFTAQEILENIVPDAPDFPAGTDFQYSNSNYALAAFIVEALTGNSVQFELRKRIWNPLGMDFTYFGAYEDFIGPTAGVWWNFGSGLADYSNKSTKSMLSFAYGSGNIISCPSDLALLLSALMNGQLLEDESLDEMLAFVPKSYSSWTAGYGLGIHHSSNVNDLVLGHDGYYTNLTDMFYSMNCGFTVVTMTNTQTAWFGIFNPMYQILSEYCMSTELKTDSSINDLEIYPNPTVGRFEIVNKEIIEEIIITDLAGKIHHHSYPVTDQLTLSLDVQGLFFVTIITATGHSSQRIVVKK